MNRKVRWGILSTAGIAVNKVVPAMQQGDWSEVSAIASRDIAKAIQVAQRLGIPKAYGSYEELLADAEIEAIYNPLPNHLHVPWTTKAAEAGKHVLCEKPIALNMEEARQLLAVRSQRRENPGSFYGADTPAVARHVCTNQIRPHRSAAGHQWLL
jgi:predicted dehydrogenase